jgi:hypothetical protein
MHDTVEELAEAVAARVRELIPEEDGYLDVESALKFLGWSRGKSKLYALIESGALPHYRDGGENRGRLYLRRSDLRSYMESHRVHRR